jgi:hypothetical protein
MSTTLSLFTYEFQGQVLSPAFSPPPSPESDDNESVNSLEEGDSCRVEEERERRKRKMLLPAEPKQKKFVNKKPKFPTRYHEMLQPISPVTTVPWRTSQPTSSHKAPVNVLLQEEFLQLMRDCDVAKIECFLRQHSENIDINRFNVEGQTALHEACQLGNVACVKALLLFGADPRLTNRDGFSTLHLSAFSGSSELLTLVSGLKKSS